MAGTNVADNYEIEYEIPEEYSYEIEETDFSKIYLKGVLEGLRKLKLAQVDRNLEQDIDDSIDRLRTYSDPLFVLQELDYIEVELGLSEAVVGQIRHLRWEFVGIAQNLTIHNQSEDFERVADDINVNIIPNLLNYNKRKDIKDKI
jgi:hypothetical protein